MEELRLGTILNIAVSLPEGRPRWPGAVELKADEVRRPVVGQEPRRAEGSGGGRSPVRVPRVLRDLWLPQAPVRAVHLKLGGKRGAEIQKILLSHIMARGADTKGGIIGLVRLRAATSVAET